MRMDRKQFLAAACLGPALAAVDCNIAAAAEKTQTKSPRMKIEMKRLDLKHAWTLSRNTSTYKENIWVTLSADGVEGIGEAAPNVRYTETPQSTIDFLEKARPVVESADLWKYRDLQQQIALLAEGQTAAKAALDIAVMDWVGKKLGVPLYRLWGLDRSKVPVTTFTIGIDTPEIMQQKVKEAEAFPVLKIKVGTAEDRRNVEAIRKVTQKPLRVDANEGWKSKEQALENIQWLTGQGVEFVEQPMPAANLEDMRWLRERVSLPLVADESVKRAGDIPRLAEAFHGINIKLMKSGGPQEALRMIQLAQSLGLKVMLGCMIESSVAIAAAAHLAPMADWLDLDGNLLIAADPYAGLILKDAKWILPTAAGLGVRPAGRG